MSNFGKPNATGRSSGKLTGREGTLRRPPQGEPWVWITGEMLGSPAWRGLSINARRLIDFLLIEHTNHAGRENGRLLAPHRQLADFGLTVESIRPAIDEAEAFGLIAVDRGGPCIGGKSPSQFRLTWFADWNGNPASDEWCGVTDDDVRTYRSEAAEQRKHHRRKKKIETSETQGKTPRKPEASRHGIPRQDEDKTSRETTNSQASESRGTYNISAPQGTEPDLFTCMIVLDMLRVQLAYAVDSGTIKSKHVAQQINVRPQHLSAWKHYRRDLDHEQLDALAGVLAGAPETLH